MNFSKPLIISTFLVLLAACGGGSSDSSSSNTIDQVTVVEIPNNEPTNFFVIDSIETKFTSFDTPISLDDFLENEFEDLITKDSELTTFNDFDVSNNLIEQNSFDIFGSPFQNTTYDYTFVNGRVTNLERVRSTFGDNNVITRTVTTNIAWNGDIPLTFSSVVFTPSTAITEETNFIYEVNSLGKVNRTFEVINGENVLSSESEFALISSDSFSVGDEINRVVFNTETNELRRVETYSYDNENNTIIAISQFIDENGSFFRETLDLITHFEEFNQTVLLRFDLNEFEGGAISNVTLTNFNYFEEVDSCGDYSDMTAFAFNNFIPNCITNLTFNN